MIHLTLTQAAEQLGLTYHHPVNFKGIAIDTRKLEPGNLFVALPGSSRDGHEFIEEAMQKGAAAALVTHEVSASLPQLIVADTVLALGKIAAAWRKQFAIPIIAVTGSNGKTTLKNMISAILVAACQNKAAVLATEGNLNNHLGLPLTLALLNATHRYAVIEMGMNHFGEIDYLTHLTRPDVAIITNAAAAHLEGVADIAGVARAKAEIFSGLTANGIAILNRDDVFYPFWLNNIGDRKHLSFGFHAEADVSAIIHEATPLQYLNLRTPQGNIDIHLPLLGQHNVLNALGAAAACLSIGISLQDIKNGLTTIQPAKGRLTLNTFANDIKIIDDTYNANPYSLQAAIHTLAHFAGKKILVLGDMQELGKEAINWHQLAGKKIREAGIDHLFTCGELSENTASAFGNGAYHFQNQAKLVTALKPFLHKQTTILVKGSRSMQMEKVIAQLVTELNN